MSLCLPPDIGASRAVTTQSGATFSASRVLTTTRLLAAVRRKRTGVMLSTPSSGVGHRHFIRRAGDAEKRGVCRFFGSIFRMDGSVFPAALGVALPCAVLTSAVRLAMTAGELDWDELGLHDPLKEYAAWGGFSFLVGFLVVFRTSQAYSRFWEGCTRTIKMRAEWIDACSNITAFCKNSTVNAKAVLKFQHLIVRLFSLLHAMALAELEDSADGMIDDVQAFRYELIDVEGLDEVSLSSLKAAECKSDLVFHWIQQCLVDNISTGMFSAPPPIISRAFQELTSGRVAFTEAMQIASIPFPFPYCQTCDCLLVIHWVVSALVVPLWVNHWLWAALFTFIQVFVLWSLNFIALEIQNPFGLDMNDLNGHQMQIEMNRNLLLLLSPEATTTPCLSECASLTHCDLRHSTKPSVTLHDIWNGSEGASGGAPELLLKADVRKSSSSLSTAMADLTHRKLEGGGATKSKNACHTPTSEDSSELTLREFKQESNGTYAPQHQHHNHIPLRFPSDSAGPGTAHEARADVPVGVPSLPVSSRRASPAAETAGSAKGAQGASGPTTVAELLSPAVTSMLLVGHTLPSALDAEFSPPSAEFPPVDVALCIEGRDASVARIGSC